MMKAKIMKEMFSHNTAIFFFSVAVAGMAIVPAFASAKSAEALETNRLADILKDTAMESAIQHDNSKAAYMVKNSTLGETTTGTYYGMLKKDFNEFKYKVHPVAVPIAITEAYANEATDKYGLHLDWHKIQNGATVVKPQNLQFRVDFPTDTQVHSVDCSMDGRHEYHEECDFGIDNTYSWFLTGGINTDNLSAGEHTFTIQVHTNLGVSAPANFSFLLAEDSLQDLPDEKVFDLGYITTDYALGGPAKIILEKNGGYSFSGNFHDSGADTYAYEIAVGILGPDKSPIIAFAHRGQTGGDIPWSPSRDDPWNVPGYSHVITEHWQEIVNGQPSIQKPEVRSTLEDLGTSAWQFLKDNWSDIAKAIVVIIG